MVSVTACSGEVEGFEPPFPAPASGVRVPVSQLAWPEPRPSLVAQWRGRCSDKAEVVRSIRTEATMRRAAQQKMEHSSTGQDVSLSKRRSGFDSRMLHRGYGVAATLLRVRQPRRVRVPLATLGL